MDKDFCDENGAKTLKRRIEEFWKDQGYLVQITIVPGPFTPAMRASRMDVRSDMLNGFPRHKMHAP